VYKFNLILATVTYDRVARSTSSRAGLVPIETFALSTSFVIFISLVGTNHSRNVSVAASLSIREVTGQFPEKCRV
jgi:hypothetical protein